MVNLSSLLNKEQITRIIEASLSNDQILYSWGARICLKKLFAIHEDDMPLEKLNKWKEAPRG